MKTTNNSAIQLGYPCQSVHPELVNALDKLANRLIDIYGDGCYLSLPYDLASRRIAATLRRLDRDGICLHPSDPEQLSKLIARASGLLRYTMKRTIYRDQKRASDKVVVESTDSEPLVADYRWHPKTSFYGSSCSLLPDESPYPGNDAFAGETGRATLQVLMSDCGLPRERALALLFMWQGRDFESVVAMLHERGVRTSPSALRRWISRNEARYRIDVREALVCQEQPPTGRASPDGGDAPADASGDPLSIYRGLKKTVANVLRKIKKLFAQYGARCGVPCENDLRWSIRKGNAAKPRHPYRAALTGAIRARN